jgi:hypothetical protein
MDKDYKTAFVNGVKRSMTERLPDFGALKLTRGVDGWDTFTGTLLYRHDLGAERAAWIVWEPGPGVERRFHVWLGWSVGAGRLPYHPARDPRLYAARAPVDGLAGGRLDLEQLEGASAIGGITIPSPWDAVALLKPTASAAVQRATMEQAQREAAAGTGAERADIVDAVLRDVVTRLEARLPDFVEAIRQWRH